MIRPHAAAPVEHGEAVARLKGIRLAVIINIPARAKAHDLLVIVEMAGLIKGRGDNERVLRTFGELDARGEGALAEFVHVRNENALVPLVDEVYAIAACGGVAANSRVRKDLVRASKEAGLKLYLPELRLCGDNGAMIGCQAYYEYLAGNTAGMDLNAVANLDI